MYTLSTWYMVQKICLATLVISEARLSSKYLYSIYVVHGPEDLSSNISDIRGETFKKVFILYLRGTWSIGFCLATLVISEARLSSKYLYSIYVVHGPEDSVQQH